ncbi:hypothetical protein ACG7TL_001720 [Trametes sanguinea]
MGFSPWVTDFGEPIYAPQDFDLNNKIKQAVDRDAMCCRLDADAPTHDEDDLPVEHAQIRGSATPSVNAVTSDSLASAPTASNGGSQTSASPTPAMSSAASPVVPADNISKDKFHAKQRAKARRLKKRPLSDAAGAPGVAKRVVKGVAVKRRAAALALSASVPSEGEVAAALAADSSSATIAGAEPIHTDFALSMDALPVAKTAFVGKRLAQTASDRADVSKGDLLAAGYQYVPWDGRPILDREEHVFAVLAGRPRDQSWDGINGELQRLFDITRDAYQFTAQQVTHRRGAFPAVTCGISYGGGQQRVSNLTQKEHNHAVLDALIKQAAVRRVANFGSAAFQLFAPRLYDYYEDSMNALYLQDPSLRPNFTNNVFAAATFNLGPRTISYTHLDHLNLPWGWCAITAVGNFDPIAGGHIVLHDLRMVIEFPPGSTILIPSAILRHSNTTIAADERRYSFTQFSAGGLFRWIEHGFQPAKNAPAGTIANTPSPLAEEQGTMDSEQGHGHEDSKVARQRMLRRERNRRYQQKLKGIIRTMKTAVPTTALPTASNIQIASAESRHPSSSGVQPIAPLQPPSAVPARTSRAYQVLRVPHTPDGTASSSRNPIQLPITPGTMDQSYLRDLNAALLAWGFVDDPRGILRRFDEQRAARDDGQDGMDAEWIHSVEDWLLEGDELLDSMQQLVVSGCMSSLCAEELGRVWGELSAIAFKVQLLMAGIEVRLDRLL